MSTITRWAQFAPSHKVEGRAVFAMALSQTARNTYPTRAEALAELIDWIADDRFVHTMEQAIGCKTQQLRVGPVECDPETNRPLTRLWTPTPTQTQTQ
jgi:hypothetical protein